MPFPLELLVAGPDKRVPMFLFLGGWGGSTPMPMNSITVDSTEYIRGVHE